MIEIFLYLIVFLIIIGILYQFVFAMIDKRRYPPLGEIIDIGNRSLHVVRSPLLNNGPTVVLEAGNGLT